MSCLCLALAGLARAAPRIDAVSPAAGPIPGGTEVVVTGSGFAGGSVRLDGTVVTPASQTDTEIRFRMPAHDNGYVIISVRVGANTAYGEYLYVPPRLEDLPPGCITTIAGIGHYVRDFGPAINATVSPNGLVFDTNGNLYIAEALNNKVSRVTPGGQIERVTASGNFDDPIGDGGLAVDAHVAFPLSLGVDPAGNVYIPDTNSRVRKVDRQTGLISTIAGTGVLGSTGDDGPALQATLGSVRHATADGADVFFLEYSDGWNKPRHRLRRIHLADGKIFAVAGTDTPGFSGDGGPAVTAQIDMHHPDHGGLALDPAGNLFFADTGNHRIRRIDRQTGIITTFYGLPADEVASNPQAGDAIWCVAVDRNGNVYYGGAAKIVKLSSAGEVLKSWGSTGVFNLAVDGAPAADGFGMVVGLAIDAVGNILFSDVFVSRVCRIDMATERLSTVAGIGPSVIGETGPAIATTLWANDVVVDRDGSIILADESALRIRRIDRAGRIATLAGNGTPFNPRPLAAPALESFGYAHSVRMDAYGELDLTQNSCVVHLDRAGIVRRVAGNGPEGYDGDGGPALNAKICQPWDSVRDAAGNLLIADTNNNRIRRINAATGTITTIVGNGGPVNGVERYGNGLYKGDGGPAIEAAIDTPYGVALDAAGNLFIAHFGAIRKVDPAGRISTFAQLVYPTKMIFDRAGNLYTAVNEGILRFDVSGNRTWVVGGASGAAGFGGDGGPALQAKVHLVNQSNGLAIDGDGNLFFCDDNRIRAVRAAAPSGPARVAPPPPARLSNVSVRTTLAADQTLIVGVTMTGGGRDLLIRAAGPALGGFGVGTPMADPRIDVFTGASLVRSNDNWDPALADTFATVGAFAFAAGSRDAALVQSVNGGYTIQAHGTGAGTVLVEAYDLGPANLPRLTNLSVRNFVGGAAGSVLIAGFTVGGPGNKPLLVRAIGPKLAGFGVSGFLANPKLELYDAQNRMLDANDDWSPALAAMFTAVGAFPLDAGSRDAALYVMLSPGSYTVQVKSADGGTGEALVELYEVP